MLLHKIDPIRALQQAWSIMESLPGGRKLFGKVVGQLVPYSGSVSPEILELKPGRAAVAMTDRRRIRNHLGSAHALAIANLGEMACGLALNIGLPKGYGAILKRIQIEYLRKARGRIVAQCDLDEIAFAGDTVVKASSVVTDGSGTVVARAETEWKVGPLKDRKHSKKEVLP